MALDRDRMEYVEGLQKRVKELEARLAAALPIIQAFARKNPKWVDEADDEQDPCGAHAWLEKDGE